ncbi:hypothetical protein [uncultured Enterovirga sp.]|uniref:hypothetical protein n=1 Tax=uncultured Enterovirga sp. TaxID=2026352 RepID=UPI0035C9ADAF
MGVKLTDAKRRELCEMSERDYRSYYDANYPPIKRLSDLGFVDREDGKYGSTTYAITPAGRQALATQEKSDAR